MPKSASLVIWGVGLDEALGKLGVDDSHLIKTMSWLRSTILKNEYILERRISADDFCRLLL